MLQLVILSTIVLILVILLIFDRLGLNVEIWRYYETDAKVWVFSQDHERLIKYTGELEDYANESQVLEWREGKNNLVVLVEQDDKAKRPRWRGRLVYHVRAGDVLPIEYTLAQDEAHPVTATKIRAWVSANFAQRFANAFAQVKFGWKDILIIVCCVGIVAVGFLTYQNSKTEKATLAQTQRLEQLWNKEFNPAESK
jgi:hypothetical protein